VDVFDAEGYETLVKAVHSVLVVVKEISSHQVLAWL
jgi:hypothetical protein